MKVLFLINDLNFGGAERVTVELTRLLAARGFDIGLLAMVDRGALRDRVDPAVRWRAILPGDHPFAGRARYQMASVALPVARAARGGCDVVVATCPFTTTVARLTQALHRRPVVGWVHFDYAGLAPYLSGWLAHATRHVYPRLQRVVFVSHGTRASMLQHLPVPAERTEVAYNPLNPAALSGPSTTLAHVRAFRRRHAGLPCLVSVGRLAPVKRLDRLLRVHARLQAQGHACTLVVVGDGECRAPLQALAHELGTADRVLFTGADPYPLQVLQQADAFCMTSHTEALPTALLEAMYAGTVVAAMDCPTGPREILDHGRCGLLTPAGDEHAMAAAIGMVLRDGAAQARYRQAASERVRDFLADAVLPRWEELLERVAESCS
jgi:glycosyltransferase involved in cell wall biosynthesis